MKPTARLITLRKYPGVVRRLQKVADIGWTDVDVEVVPAASFGDVLTALRLDVDLVALDGHGSPDGYFGRRSEWRFAAEDARAAAASGIVAPVVVHGMCWGGMDPFVQAVEGSLARPSAAFMGKTDETDFDDALPIYSPVLELLASLGPGPEPASAYEGLMAIASHLGREWRADLLTRQGCPSSGRRAAGPSATVT